LAVVLAAAGYASAGCLLAVVAYLGPRLLVRQRAGDSEVQSLSTSVVTRLGTLHALILALIFAQEMENYLSVGRLVAGESGAVADVYYGAKRYAQSDSRVGKDLPPNIARYVQTVLDEEWHLLADKRLSDQAWAAYIAVEMALLKLNPSNDYERELRRQMLDDWDQLSEYRRGREAASARGIPVFFWGLAVIGFVFVVVPYGVFAAQRANVLLIAVLGAFNGLVFYFIVQLSNPFGGTVPIEPIALKQLYEEDMNKLVTSAPRHAR
jgi:hypothetical protein